MAFEPKPKQKSDKKPQIICAYMHTYIRMRAHMGIRFKVCSRVFQASCSRVDRMMRLWLVLYRLGSRFLKVFRDWGSGLLGAVYVRVSRIPRGNSGLEGVRVIWVLIRFKLRVLEPSFGN